MGDSSKDTPANPRRATVLRVVGGIVLAAVLIGGGVAFYRYYMRDVLNDSPEYAFSGSRIVFSPEPPDWVDREQLLEGALSEPGLDRQETVLDLELPQRLAVAFAKQPWVKEVVQVRIFYPATIRVELLFRRPICLIEVKDGLYPVDPEGTYLLTIPYFARLMPDGTIAATDKQHDYLSVQGVETTPMGDIGDPWGDPAVEQAAKLAELFEREAKSLGLRKIRIERILRDPENPARGVDLRFRLTTGNNTVIIWGAFADPKIDDEMKKQRLLALAEEYGNLDRVPEKPIRLDLNGR